VTRGSSPAEGRPGSQCVGRDAQARGTVDRSTIDEDDDDRFSVAHADGTPLVVSMAPIVTGAVVPSRRCNPLGAACDVREP
jgi:hypothetical protein